MRDLAKHLRGGDFRRAVEAVAALRLLDPSAAAALVPSIDTRDEQRAFQLLIARLVMQGGVANLAASWRELESAHWREMLVSEIGQSLDRWMDEGTIELLLAALEDPEHRVARRAPRLLSECLAERTARERKALAKTQRGEAALQAFEQAAGWLTRARRARIATAVTARLERCAGDPKILTWPDDYVELLGLSATRGDARAIALLEAFRAIAGDTRYSKVEELDPDNLPRQTARVAEEKGIPPGTPFKRIESLPTGLLDGKKLEQALERIRNRAAG